MPKIIVEGWMQRYGRRKIGRTFFHRRYFVLDSTVLAYYKRKPNDLTRPQVTGKALAIDGNCRVDDRGLETHGGHPVYVLSVYNKKDKELRVTMAAWTNEEATRWKEALERVIEDVSTGHARIGLGIDSHGMNSHGMDSHVMDSHGMDSQPKAVNLDHLASSSDRESQGAGQEEDGDKTDKSKKYLRNLTYGNGIPEWVPDWSTSIDESKVERKRGTKKHWRLVRCQNGLRFFEEIPDQLVQTRYKAMRAVGVVEASCADIFELVMDMDETRYEWDASFHHGREVERVDGHTAVFYHRLEMDWFPTFVWPRDMCYSRYWRRNDDGSYVILFRSRQHSDCPEQPGCVRAHMESGGYTISPLQSRPGGELRAKVTQLVHIDLKGWGVGMLPSCHQHTVIHMLNSVAGIREWFAEGHVPEPTQHVINVNHKIEEATKKEAELPTPLRSSPQMDVMIYEDSDDDEDFNTPGGEEPPRKEKFPPASPNPDDVHPGEGLDSSMFSGTLKHIEGDGGRNCWSIPSSHLFRVRSKRYFSDKSKCPAGDPLLQLVTVDWFKDTKRMDHLARRKGCAAQVAAEKGYFTLAINVQVPGSSHYSMVFYFVAKHPLAKGSLLQRFVEGDESYRNGRLKLIPSVPKGSWIVRQSVGSTPCILGKAVDCSYYRGVNYLEVDVDIGSSTVANGVLGLVFGVVTSLVVDMAFLVQANSSDELPERLIGAVRISQLELSAAVTPSPEDFL